MPVFYAITIISKIEKQKKDISPCYIINASKSLKTNIPKLGLLQRLSIQDNANFSKRGVDMCMPPPW